MRLGSLAKFVVAVAPGLLLEGNVIRVAWWSADGAREAFGNAMTTTSGGSSLRLCLNAAAANVVGSSIVLLGRRGVGRLGRGRGSLGGSGVGDVVGGRFSSKHSGSGKARHHDTGYLVLLVVGDDIVLLLFQYDLDVLAGCIANMLGLSGQPKQCRDLHAASM